jgi:hypothetical protein
METQFGRDLSIEEALGLAHGLAFEGAAHQKLSELMPAELPTTAAAVIVVTEAMRPRLAELVASVPVSRDGKHVVFVAENKSLQKAVETAASRRTDVVAVTGATAFAGSAAERTRRLSLDGLESVLATQLSPDFFASITNLTLISPDGLPIDTEFTTAESGPLRDLLRQALFLMINEQLEATPATFGTLENIGALARAISSQA